MGLKTAFITGARRGLGKGFVYYLLDQKYFVFAGVREIKPEYKSTENLEYVQMDVSDDRSIEECVRNVSSKIGTIDILVNNAGVNKDSVTENHKELVSNLKDLKRELLLEMFNVNSVSPLIITQKFLSLLSSNPSFVINISSCRASFHDEFESRSANYGYRASKIALNMFTFCSVKDLPNNVKTFAVHPGSVKSDMNPEGDQTPYDQAERIIAITKKWKERFNGQFMRWSGGLYPL